MTLELFPRAKADVCRFLCLPDKSVENHVNHRGAAKFHMREAKNHQIFGM